MNTEDKYLTSKEVAELLNISDYTIKRFAREKRIPARKIGRQWRFSKQEIEEWFKSERNNGNK